MAHTDRLKKGASVHSEPDMSCQVADRWDPALLEQGIFEILKHSFQ